MKVDVKWIKGTINNSFGLYNYNQKTEIIYFYFGVSAKGNYKIDRFENNVWNPFVPWKQSYHVNKNSISNTLQIDRVSDYLNFYLNGKLLESLKITERMGNQFGFRVSGGQTVEYRDFEFTGLKQQ